MYYFARIFFNAYYQETARKSRGLEMFSEIENLDIVLGANHFNARQRDESLNSNLARRPESAISNDFEKDHENIHVNPRVVVFDNCAESDSNSATANSSAETVQRIDFEIITRVG